METADALVRALESDGFTVLIDRRDLPYGEEWQRALHEYIRDCDSVVFLVSPHSIQSQWVRWELQQVTELRKRLLPVVIEPCPVDTLPPSVARIELLPKSGVFTLARDIPLLVQALNTNRAWVMEATKLQSRTRDWMNASRTSELLLRGSALEAAETWRADKPKTETISGDVLDFLLSSRQGATRRQRYWLIGSLGVAIGASILAATAYLQWAEASRQRAEALRQSNAAIAQSAAVTSLASDNDPVRELLLADEALRRSDGKPTVTTLAAHRNALARFGPVPLIEAGRRGVAVTDVSDPNALMRDRMIGTVQLSEDGRWLAVGAQAQGADEVWTLDLAQDDPASTFRVMDTGLIDAIGSSGYASGAPAVSRTGRFVATLPGPAGTSVFDLRGGPGTPMRLAKWLDESPSYLTLQFSADERWLTNGHSLWNLAGSSATIKPTPLPQDAVSGEVFYTRDSARIGAASRGPDGKPIVMTWRVASLNDPRRQTFTSLAAARVAYPQVSWKPASEEKVHSSASLDGRWEITWAEIYLNRWTISRAVVRHFDEHGKALLEHKMPAATKSDPDQDEIQGEAGAIEDAQFSADGRWLATIGESLQVWDLTAGHPFAKPFADLSTPGRRVAIDASGHWVASFGTRLQLWDLHLEVPAAFPVNAHSVLDNIGTEPDDLTLTFAGNGAWLLVQARVLTSPVVELFDLRLDRTVRDSALARRNLTAGEWRSAFGATAYQKTFADIPMATDAMNAADALARAGKVADATSAYKAILLQEPGIRLDPQRRAQQLASQLYWTQGETKALEYKCAAARRLLQQAKQLNPAIPWDPNARTGQLCARHYSVLLDQLAGKSSSSSEPAAATPAGAESQLVALRELIKSYPALQFDGHTQDARAAPGESLYQFGLRMLTQRTRNTASQGELDTALALRAILIRERWPDTPPAEELQQAADVGLTKQFSDQLYSSYWLSAAGTADKMAAITPAAGARFHAALEIAQGFAAIGSLQDYVKLAPDDIARLRTLLNTLANSEDPDSTFRLMNPAFLNRVCWKGTTTEALPTLVLPFCEAAVRLADDAERPQYRDSRAVAYAATGRYDAAIDDFNNFLSQQQSPSTDAARALRREWVAALETCRATPAACHNPLADPQTLRQLQ